MKPLPVLPPLAWPHLNRPICCQAAIRVPPNTPWPLRTWDPLPGWRYCAHGVTTSERVDGHQLCREHVRCARRRGTERLLPKLAWWYPTAERVEHVLEALDERKTHQ